MIRYLLATMLALAATLAIAQGAAKTVVPTVALHVIERDPDDDRVLECAVTAKAEFIVTGDSDLLDIGEYEGIEILQVAEFLNRVGDQEQP